MSDILRNFVYDFGRIDSVIGCDEFEPSAEQESAQFDEIQFSFEFGIVTVAAESEFDTVGLLLVESSLPIKKDVSDIYPRSQILGCSLLWAWLITNEQGYVDGFQFEVRTPDDYMAVQLMREASSLSVRVVAPT